MEANSLKLLAIDDSTDILLVLKDLVRVALPGCALLTASSGPKGLELARAEDPDAILLDIVMPGMDGYAVCRALKDDERLHTIPVLFRTCLGDDRESRVKALEAGADGFLTKPFDQVELVAQIRAMARIKAANRLQRLEKEQLAALVAKTTQELRLEVAAYKRAAEEGQALLTTAQLEKNRLSALIDAITDEVWFADTGGEFVLANAAALREFGLGLHERPHVEELAKSLDVFRPDGSPRPVEESPPLRALAGEVVRNQEEIVRTPATGELRHRQVSSTPVKDLEGRIIGSVSVVRDITQHRQSEEAHRDAEARYRLLFDQSPDGIVVIEPGTGRILEFNETAHGQLGYSREEFARFSISDLDVEETPEETHAAIATTVLQGRSDFETRHRTRQGEIRNVYVTALFSQTQGHPVYHCVWRDITARKRSEEQIKSQLEELQRFESVMLDREDRVQELKREANELCRRLGEPVRYPSQEGAVISNQ